jgi:hypothetical protein
LECHGFPEGIGAGIEAVGVGVEVEAEAAELRVIPATVRPAKAHEPSIKFNFALLLGA